MMRCPAVNARSALARAIEHPYSLAVALAYGCITHQMRDDLPRLREAVAELSGLCASATASPTTANGR